MYPQVLRKSACSLKHEVTGGPSFSARKRCPPPCRPRGSHTLILNSVSLIYFNGTLPNPLSAPKHLGHSESSCNRYQSPIVTTYQCTCAHPRLG
jgi:hypothetical protein